MTILAQLHADIDRRVQTIRADRADWLCGKGCDHCCRQLADIPQLTLPEWNLLREGLTMLPQQRLEEIGSNIAALGRNPARPVTCPVLELTTGSCPVYLQRPVACRTYGFYVQRDKGLYCHEIESQVAAGSLPDVVWGNHDAINQQLGGLGEIRALTEWFAAWITTCEPVQA